MYQLRLGNFTHPVQQIDVMSSCEFICVVHDLSYNGQKGFMLFNRATGLPLKRGFKWTLESVPVTTA